MDGEIVSGGVEVGSITLELQTRALFSIVEGEDLKLEVDVTAIDMADGNAVVLPVELGWELDGLHDDFDEATARQVTIDATSLANLGLLASDTPTQ